LTAKPGATATSPASLSSRLGVSPPALRGLSGELRVAPQPANAIATTSRARPPTDRDGIIGAPFELFVRRGQSSDQAPDLQRHFSVGNFAGASTTMLESWSHEA